MNTQDVTRASRFREYNQFSKQALIRIYTQGFYRPDGGWVQGLTPEREVARWCKEEIINSLLSMEGLGW